MLQALPLWFSSHRSQIKERNSDLHFPASSFSGGLAEEPACNAGDLFDPWLEDPTPAFLAGESGVGC